MKLLILASLFFASISCSGAADGPISGRQTGAQGRAASGPALHLAATSGAKTIKVTPLLAVAQEKTPAATSDKSLSASAIRDGR